MSIHFHLPGPAVTKWDFKLTITTSSNGTATLDISKDEEKFTVKGSLNEQADSGENSFTFDLSDGNESVNIQLKKRQLEEFIQACRDENVLGYIMMDFPIKNFEGENKTETAEKIRDWIFGLEAGSSGEMMSDDGYNPVKNSKTR